MYREGDLSPSLSRVAFDWACGPVSPLAIGFGLASLGFNRPCKMLRRAKRLTKEHKHGVTVSQRSKRRGLRKDQLV